VISSYEIPSLRDRTFLITGANSGIGRAMAELLAAREARLILAGRSPERMAPVLEQIRRQHPAASASFLEVDLADFASVRRAAEQVLATNGDIDVLVNNAGIAAIDGLSAAGYHLTYATNHLGPFLFTALLLPKLTSAGQARIVNVSSAAHYHARPFDWRYLAPNPPSSKGRLLDYANSKLMNVLHAKELARRLSGTGVTTYAVHPGGVASNIWRTLPGPFEWLIKLFLISNEEGAKGPLACATAPELAGVTGRYYDKEREVRPNTMADDTALAAELWERSAKVTGAPA
jgi:dehydrogenase/reductase SDR family protein 13